MVTGDNIITATAIALECGILDDNDFGEEGVCMEG
jgi:magnesium-transporting ATPase (P-type)